VLRFNLIGDEGACSLASSLVENATLQIVDLDNNPLIDASKKSPQFATEIKRIFTVRT
jgi:hypothetical protein